MLDDVAERDVQLAVLEVLLGQCGCFKSNQHPSDLFWRKLDLGISCTHPLLKLVVQLAVVVEAHIRYGFFLAAVGLLHA